MRRREFILGVGEVSVLAALPVARAQEAGRRYRIAILTNTPREVAFGADDVFERLWPAFLAELGHGGFVEGGNRVSELKGWQGGCPILEAAIYLPGLRHEGRRRPAELPLGRRCTAR
jgi:hypothetical protein